MKYWKVIIFCLFSIALADDDSEILNEYYRIFGKPDLKSLSSSFVTDFGKFKENYKYVKKHNEAFERGEVSFELRLNHLAKFSIEELMQMYTSQIKTDKNKPRMKKYGYVDLNLLKDLESYELLEKNTKKTTKKNKTTKTTKKRTSKTTQRTTTTITTPRTTTTITTPRTTTTITTRDKAQVIIDWREKGFVSSVKNQGYCGCCYAFASLSAVESAFAIKNKTPFELKDLSEQQIIDCSYYGVLDSTNMTYGNKGCNGGFPYNTLAYLMFQGAMDENSYVYEKLYYNKTTDKDHETCRYNYFNITDVLSGFLLLNTKTSLIEQYILKQPLLTYFSVQKDFFFYKPNTIYESNLCKSKSANHMVVLVGLGYENGTKYWIVKNSYGSKWGDNGYFRIKAGQNECKIEEEFFFLEATESH